MRKYLAILFTVHGLLVAGMAFGQDCYQARDCGFNMACVNGSCESMNGNCYNARDCSFNEACVNGRCESMGGECYNARDCYPGQACVNGRCEGSARPLCYRDDDCANSSYGHYCANGRCFPTP